MTAAGIVARPVIEGGFLADVAPEDIGRLAARIQIPLVELRPGDGANLEQMFLDLTAATAREGSATQGAPQ